jgi:ribosomal-protein-alanine N-acetyltransferase
MSIVIRPMLRLDLLRVQETERRAQATPWAASLFAASLAAGHEAWVLEVGRTPAGHGVLSVRRTEASLLNLCVHPAFRGRGLGRPLLAHFIERARLRGASGVRLLVRAGNREALRLYGAAGFLEAGRRRGYYPAPSGREDALVLRLHL